MWIERNSHVHKKHGSCHQAEEKAVEEAIRWEFNRGLDGLPAELRGNFDGEVEKILEDKNVIGRQQWLATIWYARDYLRTSQGLDMEDRNPLARAFIERFKVRRKRRRGEVG